MAEPGPATRWHPSDDPSLPTDVVLTAWRDAGYGVRAVGRGHQVVMAPGRWTYLDHAQSADPDEPQGQPGKLLPLADVYSYDPLGGGLPIATGDAAGVLGTQAQLWTEFAANPEHVEYLAYPRLCAFADTAWSTAPRDYPGFLARLATHSERLRQLGIRGGRTPSAVDA